MKPGSVVTVSFPFTDLSDMKRRPALVLVVRGDDLVVCGMTSRLSGRGDAVTVDAGHMAKGRLPVRSEIRPLKLFTVHRALVRTVVGQVTDETLDRVLGILRAALAGKRGTR